MSLPGCKPVSVPLRVAVIHLDRTLLSGSSDLPESKRSGPLLLPYLVLLRVGFALPAGSLRPRCAFTAPFHPYLVRGGIFSVALSVKPALSGSPRPLAGTLPYGDRTFLPLFRSDHPPGKAKSIMSRSGAILSRASHGAFLLRVVT